MVHTPANWRQRKPTWTRRVRGGTIQHPVLEGEKVWAFTDGDNLEVRVSCAKDAGTLDEVVPDALAVPLEIAAPVDMNISAEMRTRVRPIVKVKPKAVGG